MTGGMGAAVVVLLGALAFAGCNDEGDGKPPEDEYDLRLFDHGYVTRPARTAHVPPEFITHLVGDQQSLDQLAQRWLGQRNATQVDFSHRVALFLVFNGTPTGGWTIEVDNATFEEGLYQVHVTTTAPGERCVATGAVERVIDIATVDRKLKTVDNRRIDIERTHLAPPCLAPR